MLHAYLSRCSGNAFFEHLSHLSHLLCSEIDLKNFHSFCDRPSVIDPIFTVSFVNSDLSPLIKQFFFTAIARYCPNSVC